MAEPTYEELKARLSELEKQGRPPHRQPGIPRQRKRRRQRLRPGPFPVTLYYEQWTRLLEASDKLREFLEENKSKLKLKGN